MINKNSVLKGFLFGLLGFLAFNVFYFFERNSEPPIRWEMHPEMVKELGHDLPFLMDYNYKNISNFLQKDDTFKSKLFMHIKRLIIEKQCIEKLSGKCTELRFLKMKDHYSFFLDWQDNEKQEVLENRQEVEDKIEKFFRAYSDMRVTRGNPLISIVHYKEDANVVVNIFKELSSKKNCLVKSKIQDNILIFSEISISFSDVANRTDNHYCLGEAVAKFYDIGSAINIELEENLFSDQTDIFASLVIEYYRWLSNSKNYPEDVKALNKSIKSYVDYLYDKFH